eukprot:XP_016658601.1 PREDICTED: slowpoke-binding protein [Acyrthosiphon pisum]
MDMLQLCLGDDNESLVAKSRACDLMNGLKENDSANFVITLRGLYPNHLFETQVLGTRCIQVLKHRKKTFKQTYSRIGVNNRFWVMTVALVSGFGLLGFLAYWIRKACSNGSRYQYTALEPDSMGQERMELERKARQHAQNACKHYLRFCPRYALLQHLNDIGSRVDKHWFVVRDGSVKTERLLTLVPKNPKSVLECTPDTRRTILDLFLTLQHPYIYPVLDVEFVEGATDPETTFITLVLPFNSKGSLKDLIYKSCWHDDWSDKYGQRSEGLPLSQIQRLGRQILEALLFLKERKFPHDCNLHSGNVILQNGVARITGLENSLLGFTSRIQPIVMSGNFILDDFSAIDVICFGIKLLYI